MQPPFETKEIDVRYLKRNRLSVKKNKNNIYWEYRNEAFNKDKDKAKSYNSSSANQPQTQALKKDKRGCWKSYPATRVNVIKVAKKDKDKAKDLSHIKCYTCKQKSHYVNKYLEKSKN